MWISKLYSPRAAENSYPATEKSFCVWCLFDGYETLDPVKKGTELLDDSLILMQNTEKKVGETKQGIRFPYFEDYWSNKRQDEVNFKLQDNFQQSRLQQPQPWMLKISYTNECPLKASFFLIPFKILPDRLIYD